MFWQNFVRLCSKVGKSPARVANELGLSNAVATSWKKGAMPRDSTLLQIADYFGVPVESLTMEPPPVSDNKESPVPKDGDGFEKRAYALIQSASRLSAERQALLLVALEAVVQAVQGSSPENETATQRPFDAQTVIARAIPAAVHNNP